MNIVFTKHAQKKMQVRHIPELMIHAAYCFGEKIYAQNSLYFFMGYRAIQRMLKVYMPDNPDKWQGLTLVCDPKTHTLITVFKNRKWLKKVKY